MEPRQLKVWRPKSILLTTLLIHVWKYTVKHGSEDMDVKALKGKLVIRRGSKTVKDILLEPRMEECLE